MCPSVQKIEHFDYHTNGSASSLDFCIKEEKKALGSLSLCTCMSIVYDGLDGVPRGEVDEGEVTQVVVGLNMAGDDINRRLPFFSTESTGDVSPVGRGVVYET